MTTFCVCAGLLTSVVGIQMVFVRVERGAESVRWRPRESEAMEVMVMVSKTVVGTVMVVVGAVMVVVKLGKKKGGVNSGGKVDGKD